MGDRVLFQVVQSRRNSDGPDIVGPVVYCHWSGYRAPKIVRALASRMADRPGDVDYATARLVQEAIALGDVDGSQGFGVFNAPTLGGGQSERLTAEDSHGDAGVVLIDCSDGFRCECLGGYLRTGPDGFPVERP